jgi:hypothetical protein
MFKDYPNNWRTLLLSYQFEYLHLTVVFDVLTPMNDELVMRFVNRLFHDLPPTIKVKFHLSSFKSEYNEKHGKTAYDVEILTPEFAKFIPMIERYNRATYRPHISIPSDEKPFTDSIITMRISAKHGIMKKDQFSGFPYYIYNYLVKGESS